MRVLVDTCVWVHFLNKGDSVLETLLQEDLVSCHSLVVGELATGNLPNRKNTLNALLALPRLPEADFTEIMYLIEKHRLYGQGLHWNDCSLLASARINHTPLWTRDRRLADAAQACGCAWNG